MRLRMDSPLSCRTYKPQVVAVALWATHLMNVTRSALRTAKRLQVCLIPPLLATVAGRIVCLTLLRVKCRAGVSPVRLGSATEPFALQYRGVQTISDLLEEALDVLRIV